MKCKPFLALTATALALCFLAGCGPNTSPATTAAPSPASNLESSPTEQLPTFNIADYYDADGSFSVLGLALEEGDSGKMLDAVRGDRFAVGDRTYEVSAENFTFVF